MRRYPVIEIRYTSAFIVSSRHNNARGINSTREKSASDDVHIDVMHAPFYTYDMRYRSRKLNFIRTRERINYVKSEGVLDLGGDCNSETIEPNVEKNL